MVRSKNIEIDRHMAAFGELLWERRRDMELSLQDLADRLNEEPEVNSAYPNGMLRQSVHQWEAGKAYPPRCIDPALCRVLKLKPKDLVF